MPVPPVDLPRAAAFYLQQMFTEFDSIASAGAYSTSYLVKPTIQPDPKFVNLDNEIDAAENPGGGPGAKNKALEFYGMIFAAFSQALKSVNSDAWETPVLLNSWLNYAMYSSEPWPMARYIRDFTGRVTISGLVKRGNKTVPIFYLPEGYRPAKILLFAANTDWGYADLRVYPDGSVVLQSIPGDPSPVGWLSLEISFLAETIPPELP